MQFCLSKCLNRGTCILCLTFSFILAWISKKFARVHCGSDSGGEKIRHDCKACWALVNVSAPVFLCIISVFIISRTTYGSLHRHISYLSSSSSLSAPPASLSKLPLSPLSFLYRLTLPFLCALHLSYHIKVYFNIMCHSPSLHFILKVFVPLVPPHISIVLRFQRHVRPLSHTFSMRKTV